MANDKTLRKRTVWKDTELEHLIISFLSNSKPTRKEMELMALKMGREFYQVSNWFQNQRQKDRAAKKLKKRAEKILENDNSPKIGM